MSELTETLTLKLVNPNAHKESKLRETRDEYQHALHEAFTQNCDTQGKANDVVVEYDLSGYAKNALKQYVPNLLDDNTYGAKELRDGDHPVRFTNEGPDLDHKPQNAIEWYAKYLIMRITTCGSPHNPNRISVSGSKLYTTGRRRWVSVNSSSEKESGIST